IRVFKTKCEEIKRKLSEQRAAKLEVDDDNICFSSKITREKFEELCDDLFVSVLSPVKKALTDAEMTPSAIHDIVLVGGSTRIPKIEQLLQEYFGEDKKLNKSINPDEAVAHG